MLNRRLWEVCLTCIGYAKEEIELDWEIWEETADAAVCEALRMLAKWEIYVKRVKSVKEVK